MLSTFVKFIGHSYIFFSIVPVQVSNSTDFFGGGFVKLFMYFLFKSCVRYMCCEYFPSWYLFIHFLKNILWWAEMFNFNDVQFINFLVYDLCFLCGGQEICAYSEVTKTSSNVF